MSYTVSWFDRLRIERVVWSLDQRLYDLPRRSRIETRREVRANLLSAAHDVGSSAALRQLGNANQLAREYLSAEYGDLPRPSWIGAIYWISAVPLVFNWLTSEAMFAFRVGIVARDPHTTGTYTWSGLKYVQSIVTYTFADGKASSVGGAWTPLVYAILLLGTVLFGRLWRLPAAWRRWRSGPTAAAAEQRGGSR